MTEYAITFGWIVLGVDGIVLLISTACLSYNFVALMKYDSLIDNKNKESVAYRALMLGMSSMYVLANYQALQRHIDTFIFKELTDMPEDFLDSLMSDRAFMLATAVFMALLTLKFVPSWFRRG